jgi:hypothetical protein
LPAHDQANSIPSIVVRANFLQIINFSESAAGQGNGRDKYAPGYPNYLAAVLNRFIRMF